MRLAYDVDETLQQPQPPGAAAPVEIAGNPGDHRAEDGKDQQAVEDVVAVLVEEGFLIVIQIGERAGMRDDVSVLVGRRRLDLDFARHRGSERLPR
jgi:hypothetical protein